MIWIVSLGSGTSGGVVAPVLMTGAALGGVEAFYLPHLGPGFWELSSMGAMLAATMGCPITGVVFAIELTHDFNMLLPLLTTCFVAYGLTALVLKRSILTEKIARRGYHLSREYATDPLEILFVREVMQPTADAAQRAGEAVAYEGEPLRAVVYRMAETGVTRMQVWGEGEDVVGVITLEDLLQARSRHLEEERLRERVFRMGPWGEEPVS